MTDAWQEMDDWCAKRCAKITTSVNAYIMAGGDLDGPEHRLKVGEYIGLAAMRSFIHGARNARRAA